MTAAAYYPSPLGRILLAEENHALTGLWFEDQKYYADTLKQETAVLAPDSEVLQQAARWLDRYFQGEKPSPGELPLAPEGTPFCREVWKILCEIPYGETVTYGRIARRIAASHGRQNMSARAVGNAVAHNPISIIIPCHRVIGTGGRLTGYAGGLDRKRKLLALEGAVQGLLL